MKIQFPEDLNRMSDVFFIIIMLVLSKIHYISYKYIFKFVLSNFLVNPFLKNIIFKPLIGNNTFPIIGKGNRPDGAKNCSFIREDFFDSNIIPRLSKSYGFPSGHSQSSGYFITFIYEHFGCNNIIFYIFLLYSLYIPYTRVQLGCHTIQQTIFGYLFGIIIYYLFEKIKY